MPRCSRFMGFATLARIMNSTSATRAELAVEIILAFSSSTSPNTNRQLTERNKVIPAGVAIRKTLPRKLPRILSLFGSSESTKLGIPMVNMLIRVICEGFNGYCSTLIRENIARSSEKIFLVRYSVAVLMMLLTTRRPSATTSGIREKSESIRTSCAALEAASLPEAIAMEMSASRSARMSFTPSPVMPTVFPCFWSPLTNIRFCSGVTRPNTV